MPRREPAIVDPVTNQVLRRAIAAVDSEFAATVQERMTATVGRHWAVLLARSGHFYCPPMGSFPWPPTNGLLRTRKWIGHW